MLLALLPGALTIYLAFHAGGYFAGEAAALAILLLVVLAARIMLARDPAAGLSRPLLAAAAALALFMLWTLVSGGWSHAPARALAEADRALLYLCALLLFGTLGGGADRLRWILRGLALAAVVVCAAALATRLLPGVWPIDYTSLSPRLSYPVTYWNALGLLATLGVILCFGMTCGEREPRAVRVLACAAIPLLATTLLLTLSRGSILVAILGLVVFAVAAHPRGLISGLLAGGPATAVAVVFAYNADLLVSADPLTDAALDQGATLALVLALCVTGAALLRMLLLRFDDVLSGVQLTPPARRRLLTTGIATVAVALAASAVAVDVPRQYDRFVSATAVTTAANTDLRVRLSDASSNGRVAQWRVARDQFAATPVGGQGAGTYEATWVQNRPFAGVVRDGHSLYLEVLSELGLVGFAFIAAAVLALLVGVALRVRGPDRATYATVLAVLLAWAVAAGADWHWEMPVVTLGVFALGGTALARAGAGAGAGTAPRNPPLWARSLATGVCCVLALLLPVRMAISQDRLDTSLDAFVAGRCATAVAAAQDSLRAVGGRAQPYEVLAYCALIGGDSVGAVTRMGDALHRDPGNWTLHYGLARLQAMAGRDPRRAAGDALRLNPREALARETVARFAGLQRPAQWRRAATGMEILLPDL